MADVDAIQRLAAIFAADVVGYSRLMEADEPATIAALDSARALFAARIEANRGRVVDMAGDSVLAVFETAAGALQAALAIQEALAETAAPLPDDRRMQYRVGIHLGDIYEKPDGSVYGDGINVAARLEGLAAPGGIVVSGAVHDGVRGRFGLAYASMGEQAVKNLREPVRAYRVLAEGEAVAGIPWRQRLRRAPVTAAVALLVIAIAAIAVWQATRAPEIEIAVMPDRVRLAVLPFANLSAEPENEYFSDGMTEELIAKLSQLRNLTVIARTSVMQYKGTVKGIAEIGQELSVGTILEGSVRRDGDRLRITAQLIDVASEGHLWSETYDRAYADVFAVQSDVAQQVARALQVALQAGEAERLDTPGTDDLEAYDLYLQGLFHWSQMTGEGLDAGRAFFERAVERDPSFAKAHAGLAQAYELLGEFGYLPVNEAFPKAMAAAEKALALDNTIAEAHTVLALMRTYLHFDWQAAERGHRRGLDVNPNSAYAHEVYGILYLTPHGRHDEAMAELRRAIELDPFSVLYHQDVAWVLYFARRWDEALAEFRKVLEMEPEFANAYRGLGLLYAEMERFEPAIEALRKAVEYSGESASQLSALGWAYGVAGQRADALGVLERLRAMAEQGFVDPMDFAMVHIGLGDKDESFSWLEKAYEGGAGSWRLIFLNVYPAFDSLRSDPRFDALVRKIGLGD